MTDIISATDLSAGYKTTTIWQDAAFKVAPGEFVGLLGSNGAGKTTLFRLLLGLDRPRKGKILVFGEKPKRGNPRIGYIPQRRAIDTESSIEALEYVRLGAYGNRWGFSTQAQSEYTLALEALKLVDGEDLAHKPLSQMSGGEQQRIFLAQALVGNPELLLLDEPLANLDIRRETQLIQLVKRIAKDRGIAVLLIAHDINPLLPVIDSIMYIAGGKIATGKPEAIVTSEILSNLYDAPIEVIRSPKGRVAVLGVEEALHHER